MEVKGFKDITGQEFVAEVIDIDDNFITIKNPICLVPTEKGMMPIPYIMSSTDNLRLKWNSLMFDPFNVVDNIGNFYREKFGGIVQLPSNLIL